jgi:hypothetical protein
MGRILNDLNTSIDRIDIFYHMIFRTDGKSGILVDRAERTVIPGTVSGYTNKEAVGFTGRPDGTLFKSLIFFRCFVFCIHWNRILKEIFCLSFFQNHKHPGYKIKQFTKINIKTS